MALEYECSYAGVPLLSDRSVVTALPGRNAQAVKRQSPDPEIWDEINRLIPTFYSRTFQGAQQFLGKNLSSLAQKYLDQTNEVRLNQWWYPSGASRWSVFRGLATSSQYKEMLRLTGGVAPKTLKMQGKPTNTSSPLSSYTLESLMYLYEGRPLAEHGSKYDGLWLINCLDFRYSWSSISATLHVDQNSTWVSLLAQISEALGINLEYSSISSNYSKPEPDSQLWCNEESCSTLLDAVAYNIGRILCRRLDGTYTLRTAEESVAVVGTNRSAGLRVVRLAGGEFFCSGNATKVGDTRAARSQFVSENVTVTFPKYVIGDDPVPHYLNTRYAPPRASVWNEDSFGEVYKISTPITSGGIYVSGLVGVNSLYTIKDVAKALYLTEADAGEDPENKEDLELIARQLAVDYYSWQVGAALDEVIPGTYAWQPEGFHDIVWTYSERSRVASTRVYRQQWNVSPVDMQHSCPGEITPGVGGKSVPQTWRSDDGIDVVYGVNLVTGGAGVSITPGVQTSGGIQEVIFSVESEDLFASGNTLNWEYLTFNIDNTAYNYGSGVVTNYGGGTNNYFYKAVNYNVVTFTQSGGTGQVTNQNYTYGLSGVAGTGGSATYINTNFYYGVSGVPAAGGNVATYNSTIFNVINSGVSVTYGGVSGATLNFVSGINVGFCTPSSYCSGQTVTYTNNTFLVSSGQSVQYGVSGVNYSGQVVVFGNYPFVINGGMTFPLLPTGPGGGLTFPLALEPEDVVPLVIPGLEEEEDPEDVLHLPNFGIFVHPNGLGGFDLWMAPGGGGVPVQIGGIPDGDKGDITVTSGGTTWTIDPAVVTDAKLRDSVGLSVMGREPNTTGSPADIVATNNDEVLRRNGTSLNFGQVMTAGYTDKSVTYPKMQDAAALSALGRSANSTGSLADMVAANAGEVLRRSGTVLGFGQTLTTSYENKSVTYGKIQDIAAESRITGRGQGAGAGVMQEISLGAGLAMSGTVLYPTSGGGGGVTDGDKGDITVSSGGTYWIIDPTVVTDAKLRDSVGISVIGRSANSTGSPADIVGVSGTNHVLRISGSLLGFGQTLTASYENKSVTYGKIQDISAASRLLGRGEGGGAGVTQEISLGAGLAMSGTVLYPTSGGGAGSDIFVKVTSADTTAGYLQDKTQAGTGIGLSVVNPAGNEKLLITSTGVSIFYRKYTIGFAQVAALGAVMTGFLDIGTLPAGTVFHGSWGVTRQAFDIFDIAADFGYPSLTSYFWGGFGLAGATDTYFNSSPQVYPSIIASGVGTVTLRVSFAATGGNFNTLTTGSLEIFIAYAVLV